MQEVQVWSLGQEDPLEEETATRLRIFAWEIPWTEEPGRLQSMRLQRVEHNWVTECEHTEYKLEAHKLFPNKLALNLRSERTIRIIQINVMGINISGWRYVWRYYEDIDEGKHIWLRNQKKLVWLGYGEQEGKEEKVRQCYLCVESTSMSGPGQHNKDLRFLFQGMRKLMTVCR